MPPPQDGKPPGPDEIDRGLHEILEGVGGEAAVREPSAAERAAERPGPGSGKPARWRGYLKAGRLRWPVRAPGQRPGSRRWRHRRAAAAGRPGSRNRRLGRAGSALRWIGILLVFAALLYGLHLLGFGPH